MGGVIKNMIVRVGADMSGLIGEFKKSGRTTENFAKQASDALRQVTLSEANLKKAMAQGGKNTYIVSLTDQIRELEQEQKALQSAGFSWGFEGFEQNETLLRNLKNELNQYIKSLRDAEEETEDVVEETKDLGKASRTSIESFAQSIKRLGIVALSLRFMRSIFGELGSIVRQYISENEALQAQVNSLKSSFGQALAPAINIVTNALAKMMPYITAVSNAIASLISNLFGPGWTTIADGAGSAAKAMSTAGGAASSLKRTLQGFDEISKLGEKSGGGGSGNNITSSIEQALPSWLSTLVESLKVSIADGDWESVGKILAENVSAAISNLSLADFMPSGKLKTWQADLTSFFQGWFKGISWADVGESIKTSISDFFENFNFGTIVENGFSSIAVDPISKAAFKALGKNSSSYFKPFIEALEGEYETVGEQIVVGVLMGISDAILKGGTWLQTYILDPLSKGLQNLFDNTEVGKFKVGVKNESPTWWSNVKSWWSKTANTPVKPFSTSVLNEAATWWQNVKDWWAQKVGQAQSFKTSVKNDASAWWQSVKNWWSETVGSVTFGATIRDDAATWWNNAKTWWNNTIGSVTFGAKIRDDSATWWNSLKQWWNEKIGTLELKIKLPKIDVTWSESSFLGVSFPKPSFSLKWNATGAILNGAQLFGMLGNTLLGGGEAGREALLPLDRHTGWMDDIADRVVAKMGASGATEQNITVNVPLDGKVLASTVVRVVNNQARTTGRNPLSAWI